MSRRNKRKNSTCFKPRLSRKNALLSVVLLSIIRYLVFSLQSDRSTTAVYTDQTCTESTTLEKAISIYNVLFFLYALYTIISQLKRKQASGRAILLKGPRQKGQSRRIQKHLLVRLPVKGKNLNDYINNLVEKIPRGTQSIAFSTISFLVYYFRQDIFIETRTKKLNNNQLKSPIDKTSLQTIEILRSILMWVILSMFALITINTINTEAKLYTKEQAVKKDIDRLIKIITDTLENTRKKRQERLKLLEERPAREKEEVMQKKNQGNKKKGGLKAHQGSIETKTNPPKKKKKERGKKIHSCRSVKPKLKILQNTNVKKSLLKSTPTEDSDKTEKSKKSKESKESKRKIVPRPKKSKSNKARLDKFNKLSDPKKAYIKKTKQKQKDFRATNKASNPNGHCQTGLFSATKKLATAGLEHINNAPTGLKFKTNSHNHSDDLINIIREIKIAFRGTDYLVAIIGHKALKPDGDSNDIDFLSFPKLLNHPPSIEEFSLIIKKLEEKGFTWRSEYDDKEKQKYLFTYRQFKAQKNNISIDITCNTLHDFLDQQKLNYYRCIREFDEWGLPQDILYKGGEDIKDLFNTSPAALKDIDLSKKGGEIAFGKRLSDPRNLIYYIKSMCIFTAWDNNKAEEQKSKELRTISIDENLERHVLTFLCEQILLTGRELKKLVKRKLSLYEFCMNIDLSIIEANKHITSTLKKHAITEDENIGLNLLSRLFSTVGIHSRSLLVFLSRSKILQQIHLPKSAANDLIDERTVCKLTHIY